MSAEYVESRPESDSERPAQVRRHSCNIHKPITFFRRRVVPQTPASLVKLSLNASSEMTGASNSIPSKDHVPELRNAVWSRAVTAATAEAVSCDAGAITR